ncbi:MAG: hypothetical protein IPK82_05985 [Polyangiaceae bacterium]|nr:hypothetical protein [Polyangiaceae bacterium]
MKRSASASIYVLLAIQVTDPLGNTGSADIDYRTLTPWPTTDINDNRGQVAFDALGRCRIYLLPPHEKTKKPPL